MCGLAGVVDLNGTRRPDPAMLRRMGDALWHRGPDDDGLLVEAGIGLAHRRLSIVGANNGRQPIFNEDGSIAMIFNGELFDYPERKPELEAKGHIFSTNTDSELLVHLYEEYGEGLFPYLKGQFAFVLVDFRRHVVLMARDRVGICPLFWSRQGDFLYFGSEIKALIASGAVEPKDDPRGLDQIFTFYALCGNRTMFEGVQAIAPGHYLKIAWRDDGKAAEPVEHKYWDFDFPDWGDEENFSEDAAIAAFEAAFSRAVEIRLRADAPVTGYLSGGVDSSYVLATAAQINGRALQCFTAQIPALGFDESDQACETARLLGEERITLVEAGSNLIADTYPALVTAAESPVLDTSCAASYALARAVRAKGHKVVLTGEGADEALAGYVWFKIRELARVLDIGDAFRPSTAISRIARKTMTKNRSFAEFKRIDGMIGGPHAQSIMYNLVSTARDRYYSAGFKEQLGDHVAYEDVGLDLERMARWHPLNRSLYLGYKVHLAGMLLTHKGDRVAMSNSVETRYPFLDEDVIAVISRLHPNLKLRRLKDKYLLRRAAERKLPQEVAWRPKYMFRAPLAESFFTSGAPYVEDLLSEASLKATGYFDVKSVRDGIGRLASGPATGRDTFASLGMVGVITTQLWHHLYLGGGLCELPGASFAPPPLPAQRAAAE